MEKREIKFRAWDNHNKVMCQPYFEIKTGESNVTEIHHSPAGGYYMTAVMQYTGLKDSAGKEIYEGDILRFRAENKWEETNYCCFEVFFHNGDSNSDYNIGWNMCRTHFHGSVCGTRHIPSFKPKNTEKMIVIGNIFENHELLK